MTVSNNWIRVVELMLEAVCVCKEFPAHKEIICTVSFNLADLF